MQGDIHTDWTSDIRQVEANNRKLERQNTKLIEQNRRIKDASRAASRSATTGAERAAASIANMAGAYLSVTKAIEFGRQAHQNYLTDIREVSAAVNKASQNIVAFAALQEGGTKAGRVTAASELATRYGVDDQGQAFNTVQALQSVHGGDFAKGMKASEAVFAASQLGIPIEKGRELEVLGASQGQAPGDALRRAYVAGQQSGRTPETIAGAAAGFKFWEDKEFANAAAGVLSGTLPEDQLSTYLKRAGQVTASTGKIAEFLTAEQRQKYLGSLGLKEGATEAQEKKFIKRLKPEQTTRLKEIEAGAGTPTTQAGRLAELAKRKIDTEEKLVKIGITEIREREALLGLIPNMQEVERIAGVIRKQAVPGLFVEQRTGVERELPTMKTTRETDVVGSKIEESLAFGPRSPELQKADKENAIRALALTRMGYRSSAGWGARLVEGEGKESRSTEWDEIQGFIMARAQQLIFGGPTGKETLIESVFQPTDFLPRLELEKAKIRQELVSTDPDAARRLPDPRRLPDQQPILDLSGTKHKNVFRALEEANARKLPDQQPVLDRLDKQTASIDRQTVAIEKQTDVIKTAARQPTPAAAQGQLAVGAER